jgi:glycosyltransferase involved in cell wall biosynthesis
VIVVNNNSTDNTEKICKDFLHNSGATNFRYFVEKNQGHSHSRNRGIKESKSSIINFIDDDAFVYPDFAKNIISFFKSNDEIKAIGGKINPVFEGNIPDWMSPYLMPLVSALDMGEREKAFTGRKFPIGANMTFRKSVFERYGLFNVNLGRKGTGLEGGDEKEVFLRLKQNSEEIIYVPSVKVDHIISQKRVELSYIKGLATGVGTSERKRVLEKGGTEIVKKIAEEIFKTTVSFVLFLFYLLQGKFLKGWMLLKFRFWVQKGLTFNR